ncbi:glutathione S-transferase family protein [Paracoccus sp. 11-3]|uniref:Glutathione S-transferase family protein n=1 Tax=Paracoccus amoyensis TaxID=2760093 RepID=A0A926GC62_9RHOB|nr:glutathione S-transferase family protein [Paracoccus amoyensis]
MEPILVYGFPSGSSMGLIAALEWLGKPYQLCRVDMFGEMQEPAYKKLNPRVETPVFITDDGEVLTESMAIALWLAVRDDRHRISFEPQSDQADRMHQFMAFINTGFTSAFGPLWTALEMEDDDPARKEALRKLGKEAVIERHDRLEEMIDKTPYLVSERPTLADGFLIGVARWLDFHDVAEKSRWPKLAAIRQRLEEDPAVAYASALENGERAQGSGACQDHLDLSEVIQRFAK